jgi:hypothetical protein
LSSSFENCEGDIAQHFQSSGDPIRVENMRGNINDQSESFDRLGMNDFMINVS